LHSINCGASTLKQITTLLCLTCLIKTAHPLTLHSINCDAPNLKQITTLLCLTCLIKTAHPLTLHSINCDAPTLTQVTNLTTLSDLLDQDCTSAMSVQIGSAHVYDSIDCDHGKPGMHLCLLLCL